MKVPLTQCSQFIFLLLHLDSFGIWNPSHTFSIYLKSHSFNAVLLLLLLPGLGSWNSVVRVSHAIWPVEKQRPGGSAGHTGHWERLTGGSRPALSPSPPHHEAGGCTVANSWGQCGIEPSAAHWGLCRGRHSASASLCVEKQLHPVALEGAVGIYCL